MATLNPFGLLGVDDAEDPSQLIAAAQQKVVAPVAKKGPASGQPAKNAVQAKLPSKPVPPSQAVRELRSEGQRGGRGTGRGDGRGRGRGRWFCRDLPDNENVISSNNGYSGGYRPSDDGDSGRNGERRAYRGGYRRRGGFSNEAAVDGEPSPRRVFDRRSGTGRGHEVKREGSGRGNWGTTSDDIAPETEGQVTEGVKNVEAEKQSGPEATENKDSPVSETEEKKEPEDKQMTLEEYIKVVEENRKRFGEPKSEERKVEVDQQFKSMQLLSNKKNDEDVFMKLSSDKDKRKEPADKANKPMSINVFLKPAEGENYFRSGGRGRGGRGGRGNSSRGGGYGGLNNTSNAEAPKIEDLEQFPSLASK